MRPARQRRAAGVLDQLSRRDSTVALYSARVGSLAACVLGIALAAAPLPLRVEGSSACPLPAEVAAKLQGLLPGPAPDGAAMHAAIIERAGKTLHLELRDAVTGAVLAQRDVVDASPCADLASVAAVVIAAWEAELRGTSPDLLPAPPLPPVRRAPSWDVGAAGLASFSGAWAWAPGGVALASVGMPSGLVAVELIAAGTAARPVAVGRGRAQWLRAGGGIGPRVRLTRDPIGVDLHLQAFFAVLSVRGAGFNEELASYGFDPGLLAGARVWYRIGAVRPWVGVGGWAWFRPQEVRVQQQGQPDATAQLPRLELLFTAGILVGGS